MKIVTCYKWVADEADIRVDERNRTLQFDRVKYKISEYDRNALEVGSELQEKYGYQFVAATCGDQVEPSLKDALSRGPENIYYVNDEKLAQADGCVTAKVLAGIIRTIGDVDLVVCGEGSGDEYAQQVGPRLAALLGYASCTYVNKITVHDHGFLVERKLEDGVEVLEVNGPAVVTVLPDMNTARIPSLKQILGAKKKPSTRLTFEDIGCNQADCAPKLKTLSTLGTVMERKCLCMNADGLPIQEAVVKLAKQLDADGALV
ncbi:electron transfer flavoprotein subunit beta/FixA family protein [Candidatus Formimonas warabiya]|uniref:Electron transfer flavoprotein small subunit n=1 Tax=Formimonas warabiya TaxID=1761012 RepID=A0A3G1KYD9_FORW1|nr:electron transfer flavoprotein subunit beta/FixA family protein [Candidatus Formimonas warabiya]ATW27496.1 electron transfer flavoprotein subunit beta [Candidatus Formimonas warabiya]